MSYERRLAAAAALADTFFPAMSRPDDATGFFGRSASTLFGGSPSVPRALFDFVEALPPPDRDGLRSLLDLAAALGLPYFPVCVREAALAAGAALSSDASRGLAALRAVTLVLAYSMTDDGGRNPNWDAFGYPGPPAVTPPPLEPLPLWSPPDAPSGLVTLDADVVVVGSGAGGGVIAGELARAGRAVVVLEAGAGYREDTYPRDERRAFHELYWRGGAQPAKDGLVSILAGATLGGGTAINWSNCFPTPPFVRARWAREHGLDDVDTPAFDAHLAAVSARCQVTSALSEDHGANAILRRGGEALGLAMRRTLRNAVPEGHDPRVDGHTGYGDRSGSKRPTSRTYLVDAAAAGARIVTRCRASRVLVEGGRAAGVRARWLGGARPVELEVRARDVVIACGALETPALLLRSGIGGPAVGRHLHVHPAAPIVGRYDERVDSWIGAPHTTQVTEFLDRTGGYGFVIEGSHFSPGLSAAVIQSPRDGREHKEVMATVGRGAAFLARLLDRGEGRVTIDAAGEAVITYPLDDALDRQHLRDGIEQLARIHRAAGALDVLDPARGGARWRRGEPLEPFVRAAQGVPLEPGRRACFSAHQMGSARLGRDVATSVADPNGELHTTPGVWIGDTSAFPSATGANPMLTALALARRTAERIAAATTGGALVAWPGEVR
jgi:choline dehydrogenase-like flavoprotein